MKRFIAAIALAVLAGSAFAADHAGPIEQSPLVRPLPGICDSLEVRDPLMDSASAGASLPDLGSADAARTLGDVQRRPLLGDRAALFGERPRSPGPRPYWENDPLFSAPLR
jgi:hypothetical protein